MNRRAALAALMSLPEITRISAAPIKPDDVIVLECNESLSLERAMEIRTTLESVWPGRKCVVLGKGMTLKVVAP